MKKSLFTFILLFLFASLSGQDNANRQIALRDKFTGLSNGGDIDMEYIQSETTEILIEGPSDIIDDVDVMVKKGMLEAKYNGKQPRKNNELFKLYIKAPAITAINMKGNADITIDRLSTDYLNVVISGPGDLHIGELKVENDITVVSIKSVGDAIIEKLLARKLTANMSSSSDLRVDDMLCQEANVIVSATSDVYLKGKCSSAVFAAGGKGDIYAEDLVTNDVKAGVSGSSDIRCHATKTLTATAHDNGYIYLWGNPSFVELEGAGENIHRK